MEQSSNIVIKNQIFQDLNYISRIKIISYFLTVPYLCIVLFTPYKKIEQFLKDFYHGNQF